MYFSKTTINILLLIAIVLLGIAVWLVEQQNPQDNTDQKPVISTLVPKQITRISISKATSNKAQLTKNHGKWFMTAPINIEANAFLANKVSEILGSQYSRKFSADEKRLVDFGLSPAQFTVRLNEHVLLFGTSNSISKQRYILFNDSIFLIPDQLVPILNSAPASFISHRLIPGDDRITSLELPQFSLKSQAGKWLLETAIDQPQQISQDRFVKFIDEWQLAQALYVSLSNKKPDTENLGKIQIHLVNGGNIVLIINKNANGLVLHRTDLGINYHMHNEADQTLLSFTITEP